MGTEGVSDVKHRLKTQGLQESLVKECRVMLDYSLANGKAVNAKMIMPLEKKDDDILSKELLPVYNYLVNLVRPASPGTLVLFEKNRQSTSRLKFLGPLPIVRSFMMLTIISLLALIGFSLSKDVNAGSIQLSMLQGYGLDQAQRLAFLLSCASVGASFYALFKMNSYISEGTFDMKFSATYWSRYVLGLVAGVLLSELFVAFIEPNVALGDADTIKTLNDHGLDESSPLASAGYLLKPILAILGGFSASLVYRILNRLIEAIESLFKGSGDQMLAHQQRKFALENQEDGNTLKSQTAGQLINLKNDLVNTGVDPNTLSKIDEVLNTLVPTAPSNETEAPVTEKAISEPEPEPTTSEPEQVPTESPAPDPATPAAEDKTEEPPADDPKEGKKPGTSSW